MSSRNRNRIDLDLKKAPELDPDRKRIPPGNSFV